MKNTFIALLTIALLAVSPVAFAYECPLCVAAENGDLSEVKRLLNFAGTEDITDVNDKEDKRARAHALYKMVTSNNEDDKKRAKDILRAALKEQGIDPKRATSEQKENALLTDPNDTIYNAFEEDETLTNVHLRRAKENMTNVNNVNKYGWTALMRAAGSGHSEVVKVLLENGAKVNHKNRRGRTALMLAAKNSHNEIAKLLLECGANLDIINKDGKNALDYAKDKPILSALLKKHINDVVEGREFSSCKNESVFKNIQEWFRN